jgi:hypothetical protein
MQDAEFCTLRQRAERFCFSPGRNEEVAAACFAEQPRYFTSAEPIAVSLDRRSCRYASGALQPAPIILKSLGIETEAKRVVGHEAALASSFILVEGRFGALPVTSVKMFDGKVDRLIKAVSIDAPSVGMAARLVEALHAAH